MNLPLPKTTQGVYRLSVSTFYFLQGLVFASWACRIPDIKNALGLNDADLGSVLFAVPVGQMSAMALSGYLVGRCGSRRILIAASIFYPAVLVYLGMASSFWELAAGLFFFGVAANLTNISVNTQGVGVERLYQCSIMARFHGLWSLAGFFGALLGAVMVDWKVSTEMHFIAIFLMCMVILAVFSPSLLPRDARRSSTQGGGMFRSMDAYVLVIGLIAFGSMVSEGTMFDWSGVYFESVVQPGPGLVQMGYVAFMSTMALGRFTADPAVEKAEEELAESVGLEHGSISIGASEIALNIYLLDRLKKFHIAYPGVQLKIYNHSTPQAISAVRSGETDFAVITTPADVEAPLKEVRLKAFKDILIGGRTFTAMGSQELSLKDLKEYPWEKKQQPIIFTTSSF